MRKKIILPDDDDVLKQYADGLGETPLEGITPIEDDEEIKEDK